MQRLVFIGIVRFLKYCYIICSTFVKISVFIRIDRINLKTDHLEIFLCDLAGFSDIFHGRFAAALAGQDQNFLQTGLCDRCHFFFDFFCI